MKPPAPDTPAILLPRQARALSPGRRMRALELLLTMQVVIAMLLVFAVWLINRKHGLIGLPLLLPILGFGALSTVRFLRARRAKRLSSVGAITTGSIRRLSLRRTLAAPRADRPSPDAPHRLAPRCWVTYGFTDLEGQTQTGHYVTHRKDRAHLRIGDAVEVLFLPNRPEIHLPTLVTRWYWTLAGHPDPDRVPIIEARPATRIRPALTEEGDTPPPEHQADSSEEPDPLEPPNDLRTD